MRSRRTAVLGGSGFIGRYVVERLAARGDVVPVGCRHAESAKFLKTFGHVGQIAAFNVAIGDDEVLPAFLAGNDALVNCVGILAERGSQTFERVHHQGPARLARFAREAGIERFVHISAIGADPRSTSAYARTKAAGEAAVRDAFPTVTILRPSVVFGPEDQFFNRFAAIAMVSPVLPLIGGGRTRFQPVYVGDVADAVVKCLDDPATAGRTYELGGPRVYNFRELIELLLDEIHRKRLMVDVPFGRLYWKLAARIPRVRLIYRPALCDGDLFQIRIWVNGERVAGHGKHLTIPDRVPKRAIGRGIEHRSNCLGFARPAGNSYEAVADDAVFDCHFGGQDAILRGCRTSAWRSE